MGMTLLNMVLFQGTWCAAVSAPLSYLAGQALRKVVIPTLPLLVVISVVWFSLFYVLFARIVPQVNRSILENF